MKSMGYIELFGQALSAFGIYVALASSHQPQAFDFK